MFLVTFTSHLWAMSENLVRTNSSSRRLQGCEIRLKDQSRLAGKEEVGRERVNRYRETRWRLMTAPKC
jgi:hypothetical protein